MRNLLPQSFALVAASAVAGLCLIGPWSRVAEAQTIVVDVPEAEYLATVQPVYFENHAAYWWHNHWTWRDGAGWHIYDHEPPFLEQRRLHDPPGRWFYDRDAHGAGYYGHDVHGGHGGHEDHGGHEAPHPNEHGHR